MHATLLKCALKSAIPEEIPLVTLFSISISYLYEIDNTDLTTQKNMKYMETKAKILQVNPKSH